MGPQRLIHKALRADIKLMLAGCMKCWSYYLPQNITIMGVVQASNWSPNWTGKATVDSILIVSIQEKVVHESLEQMLDKLGIVDLICEHPQGAIFPRHCITLTPLLHGQNTVSCIDVPTYLESKPCLFPWFNALQICA